MTGRPRPTADVIVVAFCSRDHLRSCVEPLAGQADIRVIVVDNDCPQRSTETVADLDVAVLEMGYNAGFAAACNAGAAAGDREAILFLNPDARMSPTDVRMLARGLDEDTSAAAVGPHILEQNGETQLSVRYFPRLRSAFGEALFLHHVFRRADWPTEIVRRDYGVRASVEWLSGAVLCVRRSAFQEVAGFDDRFFMYSEDADLCARLRARGWDVLYDPRPTAVHEGGGSAPRPLQAARRVRGRILYARLHTRGVHYAAFRVAYALHELLRLLAAVLRSVTHLRGRAAALRASFGGPAFTNQASVDARLRPTAETDGGVIAGADAKHG